MPRRFLILPIMTILCTLFTVTHPQSTFAEEQGFTSLFDGKTLAGWEGKEGIFRVVDGTITAGSLKENIKNNEFL